jgi:diguanylate cyclase (GGDEF)-like protein
MPLQTFSSLRSAGAAGAYFRPSVLRRLAVFLMIALPLVWVMVVRERTRLGDIARDESHRNVQNLAHAFAEEIRSSMVTIDLSLSQLRLSWLRNPGELGPIVSELNSHLHGKLQMNLVVVDTQGRIVFTGIPGVPMGLYLGEGDHIRTHLDGPATDRLFIGRPQKGRLSGRWTVPFSRPVFDQAGKLAGVIVAGVEPAYFSRFYDTVDLGANASVALVSANSIVIARTTHALTMRDGGKHMADFPYAPGSSAGGAIRRVSGLDGVDRFYGWRTLSEYGLVVAVGQSVQDANARYARQKELLLYTGVAISLALLLAGWTGLAAADNRRRGVASLAAAEARWKLALNATGEGVWDYSFRSSMITLSPSAQGIVDARDTLLPFDRGAFVAMSHPEDSAAVLQALDAHLNGAMRDYTAQYRTRLRNGNWRWILARGQVAERDADGRPLRIVGTVADIDARKLQEDQIRHQAHHDMLTGLPNRLLFGDRLHQALLASKREGHKLAVIFFDLDKFKPVNDSYGHAVGDILLQQVATRLRTTLRASDTLARLGGDEFVVLLPRVAGSGEARKVAADILRELTRPFMTEGFTLHISASVGVAVSPDCGEDADTLLRSADGAMYEAKLLGRGRVAECTAQSQLAGARLGPQRIALSRPAERCDA